MPRSQPEPTGSVSVESAIGISRFQRASSLFFGVLSIRASLRRFRQACGERLGASSSVSPARCAKTMAFAKLSSSRRLTCSQVAEEAALNIKTAQRWVKSGELEAIVLPGGGADNAKLAGRLTPPGPRHGELHAFRRAAWHEDRALVEHRPPDPARRRGYPDDARSPGDAPRLPYRRPADLVGLLLARSLEARALVGRAGLPPL